MTTGRINQVTTFRARSKRGPKQTTATLQPHRGQISQKGVFRQPGFTMLITTLRAIPPKCTTLLNAATKPPCSPFSHCFRHISTRHLTATSFMAFEENYQQPARSAKDFTQSRRILNWLIATGLAISNQSTSHFNTANSEELDLTSAQETSPLSVTRPSLFNSRAIRLIPGQYTLLDRYINNPVQNTPVIPPVPSNGTRQVQLNGTKLSRSDNQNTSLLTPAQCILQFTVLTCSLFFFM